MALTATAVLGDGLFEIAKHVWLAAYLLQVSALASVAAVVVVSAGRVVDLRRRTRTPRQSVDSGAR